MTTISGRRMARLACVGAYPYPAPVRERIRRRSRRLGTVICALSGRSTDYGVGTLDGDIGHIAEFVIDDKDWAIR